MQIRELQKEEDILIHEIANWYFEEWESPMDRTLERLSHHPNNNLLTQLVLFENGELLATGALCHDPNILKVYPELNEYGPWIAMLITKKSKRGRGLGTLVLEALEKEANTLGFSTIYLYTFTAESLYKRAGWSTFMTVEYKQHSTVVMKKDLK